MTNLKQLSYHGKSKLFKAIEEYIDAKIIMSSPPLSKAMLDDPDVYAAEYEKLKERCEKAKDELIEMLNKIEMRLI